MSRCRQRMMHILHERGLRLSKKKSRMGAIDEGVHFLGIDYPSTRPEGNTNRTQTKDVNSEQATPVQLSPNRGG